VARGRSPEAGVQVKAAPCYRWAGQGRTEAHRFARDGKCIGCGHHEQEIAARERMATHSIGDAPCFCDPMGAGAIS
jgi:hypothetical protein